MRKRKPKNLSDIRIGRLLWTGARLFLLAIEKPIGGATLGGELLEGEFEMKGLEQVTCKGLRKSPVVGCILFFSH